MDEYDKSKEIIKYYSDRSSYATNALKMIMEKFYGQNQSTYGGIYEKIAFVSDKEFADEVTNIVDADHNPYNRFE